MALARIRHNPRKVKAARDNAHRTRAGRILHIEARVGRIHKHGDVTSTKGEYFAETCVRGASHYDEPGRCVRGYGTSPTAALKKALAKMASQIK